MESVETGLEAALDFCAPDEHVPEAERNNRSIQDRVIAGFYRTPYKRIPKVMTRHLVMSAARSLNWLPAKGGISQFYSPHMILNHKNLDWNRDFKYEFGAYVHAQQVNSPSNNNKPRKVDCIYLSPDYRNPSGHILMDLNSGREIIRPNVTECVITELVIKRVEQMA